MDYGPLITNIHRIRIVCNLYRVPDTNMCTENVESSHSKSLIMVEMNQVTVHKLLVVAVYSIF